MSLKFRLSLVSFLQFFVWGAWLITLATYFFGNGLGTGTQFGAVMSTLALGSLITPGIVGIIADKWMNSERLYGILHFCYGLTLIAIAQIADADSLYYLMLLAMTFYMPTISLSNSIAYTLLKRSNYNVVKVFPPIRVWGTIGFIFAMWVTNLSGSKANVNQFYIAAIGALFLGIYSFTLPACPPENTENNKKSLSDYLGLNAFKLFANYKFALFLIFSMFLGAALQLTNMYGDTFLDDFKFVPKFGPESFVVKYSTIVMSISQISETVFILAIPFFLKRYGIKKVMLFSMLAWVLRFGLFAYGDPQLGLWMIILSCIIYGFAFDFFNISGSLFVELNTESKTRASAQGLFMMMTNGFGAFVGAKVSGWFIDKYHTFSFKSMTALLDFTKTDANNAAIKELTKFSKVNEKGEFAEAILVKNWTPIWEAFAIYALVIAILFFLFFKHKHDPKELENVAH